MGHSQVLVVPKTIMPIQDEPDTGAKNPSTIVLATVLTGTFILLAYPGIGIVRAAIGQPGVSLSPLILTPTIWLVLFLALKFEPDVQKRRDWERIQPFWYSAAVTVGLIVPLVVALVWPVPVFNELPAVVCAAICVSALPLAVVLIVARARLRNT